MSGWFDGDDRLLEELGQALGDDQPEVSDDTVEMLMTGYDLVMADTVEASLVHDSAIHATAAVRGETVGARMLSFTVDGETIEIEIADGWVVGHISPPRPLTVRLEQMADVQESATDDLGGFEFEVRSPATFRLRLMDRSGPPIATPWIDGPHPTRPPGRR